jgi:hypothetical protein
MLKNAMSITPMTPLLSARGKVSHGSVLSEKLDASRVNSQRKSTAEWGYLGKGKFQRRDFRLDILTGSSAFSAEGTLFAHLGKHEIFTPARTYPPMTVRELAVASGIPKEAA